MSGDNKEDFEWALRKCVRAWEALPQGNHSPRTVEAWMRDFLKPAIDNARELLGEPTEPPNCGS